MELSLILYGTREDWLKSKVFLRDDINSDDFTLDFRQVTVKEKIEMGYDVKEPIFKDKFQVSEESVFH